MQSINSATDEQSVFQNSHGVDLRSLEPGSSAVVCLPSCGRVGAHVLDANHAADEFFVEVRNAYEQDRRTVSGDAFRPKRQFAPNPVSDEELATLAPGERIPAYVSGHEVTIVVAVEAVDVENERVLVAGEHNAQTIHRWIPQSLLHSQDRE
jgi:hypothetical protein